MDGIGPKTERPVMVNTHWGNVEENNHGGNQLYRIAAGANSGDYAWTETLMKQLGELGCAYRPGTVRDVRSRILTAGKLQDHNTPDAPGTATPNAHEQITATTTGLRVHLPAHSFVTVEGRPA